jgi:hypothetical protein
MALIRFLPSSHNRSFRRPTNARLASTPEASAAWGQMGAAADQLTGPHRASYIKTTQFLTVANGNRVPHWVFALDGDGQPSMLVLFDDRLLYVLCSEADAPSIRYRYSGTPLRVCVECDSTGSPFSLAVEGRAGELAGAKDTFRRLKPSMPLSGFVSSMQSLGWITTAFGVPA